MKIEDFTIEKGYEIIRKKHEDFFLLMEWTKKKIKSFEADMKKRGIKSINELKGKDITRYHVLNQVCRTFTLSIHYFHHLRTYEDAKFKGLLNEFRILENSKVDEILSKEIYSKHKTNLNNIYDEHYFDEMNENDFEFNPFDKAPNPVDEKRKNKRHKDELLQQQANMFTILELTSSQRKVWKELNVKFFLWR